MTKMPLFPSVLALALIGYFGVSYAAPAQNDANCTACHSNIGTLHTGSKHANLPCATCHDGTADHLKNPKTHPTVSMSPQQCSSCHPNQFETMYKVNDHRIARDSKKNLNNISPNPFFDEALGAHGFVKEHNLPRSHAYPKLP